MKASPGGASEYLERPPRVSRSIGDRCGVDRAPLPPLGSAQGPDARTVRPGGPAMRWPKHPVIAELDAWKWLADLSHRAGRTVTLRDAPPTNGMPWPTSARRRVAHRSLGARPLLPAGGRGGPGVSGRGPAEVPDLRPDDLVGSPLAVRRYAADLRLGGRGAGGMRGELAGRARLVLDFVPGQTALDHPGCSTGLITTSRDGGEPRRTPGLFFEAGGRVLAHGRHRDGRVKPDAAQVNLFCPALIQAPARRSSQSASSVTASSATARTGS